MNRFHFPQSTVDRATKFLKSKKGTAPAFLQKFPGVFTVRQGKLYYAGNRRVIPTEQRPDFLREIVYGKKSDIPSGEIAYLRFSKTRS